MVAHVVPEWTQHDPIDQQSARLRSPLERLPVPRLAVAAHADPQGCGVAVIEHKAQRECSEQGMELVLLLGSLRAMSHSPHQFEGRPLGQGASEVWCCSGLVEAGGHLGGALL